VSATTGAADAIETATATALDTARRRFILNKYNAEEGFGF
jgi:hypothetical protein